MKNKLIADAGSTKVDWALLSKTGEVITTFTTDGINALLSDSDTIELALRNVKKSLSEDYPIEEVHFYGAGCATEAICGKMSEVMSGVWIGADINVSTDLLGAARSLFGNSKGIACILGTGSNSCLYDGKTIAKQIPSLGYVLGDEGSGAALGKRLLSDAFKHQLPESVRDQFLKEYGLTLPEILDKTYKQQSPNKFLASLVPFLSRNLWNPYVYSLVLAELTQFVKRNIAMYPGAHSMHVGFTGSIAFHFQKILREAVASQGYGVTKVTETPMEGLIDFHRNENNV